MAWLLGHPDWAVESARAGLALGEMLGHVPSLCHSFYWSGMVHQFRRDPRAAIDCGQRLIALGGEHALLLPRASGGILHGWALVQLDAAEDGLGQMREAIAAYYAEKSPVLMSYFHAVLAETEMHAGHPEKARAALAEAVADADRLGEDFWRAEMLLLDGDLLLAHGAEDEAEERYRQAITLARRQGARSLELRAATAFARLRRRQRRPEDGLALLAAVYSTFTEGLDTPDLVEARQLLEE